MLIRPFESRDIGPVTSLVRTLRAAADLGADFGGTGVDVRAVGVGERSGTWVAEVDDVVVGVAVVQPGDGDACVVQRLYVAPQHQRRGVGSALLRQCVAWARTAGFTSVEAPDSSHASVVRAMLLRLG